MGGRAGGWRERGRGGGEEVVREWEEREGGREGGSGRTCWDPHTEAREGERGKDKRDRARTEKTILKKIIKKENKLALAPEIHRE